MSRSRDSKTHIQQYRSGRPFIGEQTGHECCAAGLSCKYLINDWVPASWHQRTLPAKAAMTLLLCRRLNEYKDCPFKTRLPFVWTYYTIKCFIKTRLVALYILHFWPNFCLGLNWTVASIHWYSLFLYVYVNVLHQDVSNYDHRSLKKKFTDACCKCILRYN